MDLPLTAATCSVALGVLPGLGGVWAAAVPATLVALGFVVIFKATEVFNFAQARKAAFESGELIVVEGYMDVIALHQAGFKNVVATLGTAFTERQMERLWLIAPEPVICFDGDRAGEAAAARAIDRMLPNLREGHSFRFAFLPEGTDPDDLVRDQGAATLAQCLAGAKPLVDLVWLRELQAGAIDTPERRAALEARMAAVANSIGDDAVRKYWPALKNGALQPGYAGIRPKIHGASAPAADFVTWFRFGIVLRLTITSGDTIRSFTSCSTSVPPLSGMMKP